MATFKATEAKKTDTERVSGPSREIDDILVPASPATRPFTTSMLARWLDDVTDVPVTEKLQGDMMAVLDGLVNDKDNN